MKRILIFSDSRWRDAFGDSLLFVELSKKHEVVVASYDIWAEVVKLFKPHVMIINHVHGYRNTTLANHVKRQGGSVVVLPTEGKITSQYMLDRFITQLDSPDLDYIYAWNDLVKHRKIVVTGHPRFSIYREYADLIEPREVLHAKYRTDADKQTLVVATSFPQAKFSYHDVKFNIRDWKDLGLTKYPGREDPYAYAVREYKMLKRLQLMLRVLRDERPGLQIVLEPHPMEDRYPWESFCKENDITLIHQEYTFNLLNMGDMVLSRVGCTTVQDAWMLGKQTVRVNLYDQPDEFVKETIEIGHVADTADVLINTVNYLSTVTPEEKAARDEYLKKYGYSYTGAERRIAEHIDSFIGNINVVSDPTVPEMMALNKVLVNHETANMIPNPTAAHLGKAVTQEVTQEWVKTITRRHRQ